MACPLHRAWCPHRQYTLNASLMACLVLLPQQLAIKMSCLASMHDRPPQHSLNSTTLINTLHKKLPDMTAFCEP